MIGIKQIGVVGAGMMGAEIALCFASAGYTTFLNDMSVELAQAGKARQAAILDKQIAKGRLESSRKEEILDRVFPSADLQDLSGCGLIIEAVLEDVEIKTNVFRKLDSICGQDAVFASNTSTISITKLAAAVSLERGHRFLGTHFNSPASVMKLVEVIPGMRTDPDVTNSIVTLLEEIGKMPVRVKDVTGFALNRLLHVFTMEACRLVEEGVCTVEDVDKICRFGLGHPMGIFALMDHTGLDLNLKVNQLLFDAYGERYRPSPQLQRRVDSGMLGRKTGAGFYEYPEKRV